MKYIEKRYFFVVIIVFLGMLLRLWGVDFGLPFIYHNDESIIVNYALSYGAGDLNPHFFRLPPLLSYILFATYGMFYVIGKILGSFQTTQDFGLLFLRDPSFFYITGRVLFGVLPGTASVYFIYVLGKRCFSELTGLLSALFLSVNFLHVRNSHYIYNDIVLMMLIVCYFIILLELFEKEKLRFYLYSGIVLALGISVKYNAVFLLFPTAIAVFINMLLRKRYSPGLLLKKGAVFSCSFIVFLFLTNPFMFLDFTAFYKEFGKMMFFTPSFWFHLKISIIGSIGLVMLLASLSGMALVIMKRKIFPIILIFYTVVYYFTLTVSSQTSARYIFPILPVFLVFGAFFIDFVTASFKKRNTGIIVGCFLSIAVAVYPALKTYYVDKLFVTKDTRTQAYEWIISNIPPGEKIALDSTGPIYPKLKKTREQIKEDLQTYESRKFPKPKGALEYKIKLLLEDADNDKEAYRLYYLKPKVGRKVFFGAYPEIPVDMNALKAKDIRCVVLNRILREPDTFEVFLNNLEKNAVLVKEFSPYKKGVERLKPKESTDEPAAAFSLEELSDRKSFGPVLRIYRLRED